MNRTSLNAAEAPLALGYIGDFAGILRVDDTDRAVLDTDTTLDTGISSLGSSCIRSRAALLVGMITGNLKSSQRLNGGSGIQFDLDFSTKALCFD